MYDSLVSRPIRLSSLFSIMMTLYKLMEGSMYSYTCIMTLCIILLSEQVQAIAIYE